MKYTKITPIVSVSMHNSCIRALFWLLTCSTHTCACQLKRCTKMRLLLVAKRPPRQLHPSVHRLHYDFVVQRKFVGSHNRVPRCQRRHTSCPTVRDCTLTWFHSSACSCTSICIYTHLLWIYYTEIFFIYYLRICFEFYFVYANLKSNWTIF